MSGEEWKNKLYFGDNLAILREHVPDESVDLIYLDPPFNSKATYNVLFSEKNGTESAAQITAFEDTWHWGIESEAAYHEVVTAGGKLADLLGALRQFLGTNDMMAYLTMMAIRLKKLHRVLKLTGNIYLHCDPTASHYLKLLMDAVFGPDNFTAEIVWKRTFSHGDPQRKYGAITDAIFLYSKSDEYAFRPQYRPFEPGYIRKTFTNADLDGRRWQSVTLRSPHPRPNLTYPYTASNGATYQPHPNGWSCDLERLQRYDREGRLHFPAKPTGALRLKMYLDESPGVKVQNLWADIPPISANAQERLGFPTQKPEALLERIIQASSNEGDVVLDPFCGCGTAIAVAERLHRRWIGIDITHLAISLMRHRLHDTFDDDLASYEVVGDPKDLESARALAQENRYQFEWWALGVVEARPAQDKKKGADRGVDGHIYFFDDRSGKAKKIVVQVKSGHVMPSQIRDLKGTIDREKAAIGVFITLEEPTGSMVKEAVTAGFYQPKDFPAKKCPRIQIFTIKELLEGKKVEYPRLERAATFKQAARKRKQSKDKMDSLLTESG